MSGRLYRKLDKSRPAPKRQVARPAARGRLAQWRLSGKWRGRRPAARWRNGAVAGDAGAERHYFSAALEIALAVPGMNRRVERDTYDAAVHAWERERYLERG